MITTNLADLCEKIVWDYVILDVRFVVICEAKIRVDVFEFVWIVSFVGGSEDQELIHQPFLCCAATAITSPTCAHRNACSEQPSGEEGRNMASFLCLYFGLFLRSGIVVTL